MLDRGKGTFTRLGNSIPVPRPLTRQGVKFVERSYRIVPRLSNSGKPVFAGVQNFHLRDLSFRATIQPRPPQDVLSKQPRTTLMCDGSQISKYHKLPDEH
jgi:hypothetical protein